MDLSLIHILAYDFAERFDQEMWKYQFNLGVFSENQLYVRLGTLQDNEGISNALLYCKFRGC